MKVWISLMVICTALATYANSNDFGSSETPRKPIELEKLRHQIEIKGEILVFDKTGRRFLYKGAEERSWWFGGEKPIFSNWSFRQAGLPAMHLQHKWDLDKNGHLTAQIRQFDAMEKKGDTEDVSLGKLLREQEFPIVNLSSVDWIVSEDSSVRVVAKFSPTIWVTPEPTDIGKLPLNSSRLTIFDRQGNLWASLLDNSKGNNVYFGVTTFRGSVFLSYSPFPGAKEIGLAQKRMIRIEDGKTKLQIESADLLLPEGVSAKVYGRIDLNRRTERVNSVKSYGSDNEQSFLKNIR